jgi:hypothetical protein
MNAFASTDIILPEKYKEFFHAFCLTRSEGSRNNPEDSPFPRMVDMWFLALCIAVKEGLKTRADNNKGETYKAIEGVVFGSDNWRSNALMLLAIAESNDVKITDRPHDMMRIANAYALAGLPRLLYILGERGEDTALDYLSDFIEDLIRTGKDK